MTERDYHSCHFCGEFVSNGYDSKGERHWLSDCRPDLVQHEPGELCTWPDRINVSRINSCYAYQDGVNGSWTEEHEHFYPDGPM